MDGSQLAWLMRHLGSSTRSAELIVGALRSVSHVART